MYEALWTNGPKENIEFYDYTFDDHFGCALPVYMPREPILDYMIGRVTKNCPDFFEKYMTFNTSVDSVRFDETSSKFKVVTRNLQTSESVTRDYDKCIWAAGENGKPLIPASMVKMFREGGFDGRIIHSSDTANFEQDVKGKRILLIGGGYSAEDLSLMAVKVGVEQVYVCSRQDVNVISWTTAWPQNKVKVLNEQTPIRVTENGKCIQFAETEWAFPEDYEVDEENVETEVRDIDTVIFCTGYLPNLNMLDEELRRPFTVDKEIKLKVPADWKMEKNKLSKILGEVEPGDVRWFNSIVCYPGLYRGLSISNPSMMFLTSQTDNPLFGVDVNAWLLMRFITGARDIPSAQEMMKQNEQDALDQMQNPYIRYCMDGNYVKAFDKEKWTRKMKSLYEKYEAEHYEIYYRVLARSIQEAGYPVSYGTYDKLNDTARTIMKNDTLSSEHRYTLNPRNKKENQWRTFRDYTNGKKFKSVFTGMNAISLKQRWLDIDADDKSILEP